MAKRNKMTSVDQGKPTKVQHKKPCRDCPFLRTAIPGWLGGETPESYCGFAHSEVVIECHVKIGPQCAGAAIYRANVGKKQRPGDVKLELPQDKEAVFATPIEFLEHHNSKGTK